MYFAISVDVTTDISKKEQVSIVLRYVDERLQINEKFAGFFDTSTTTAQVLCDLMLRVLDNFGLDYNLKIVGQCYDGAANMSDCSKGLNKLIRQKAKRALYVHCYAHQLNLALQHATNEIKFARNCLNTLNLLNSFIEGSAKRHALFKLIQDPKHATVLKYL